MDITSVPCLRARGMPEPMRETPCDSAGRPARIADGLTRTVIEKTEL
jgi:hypothetical protein